MANDRHAADDAKPVFLVTGLGEGTGGAAARRFAKGGYRVAMLARSEERLRRFEAELPDSRGYVCDVADIDLLTATAVRIREEMGPPRAVLHNAVGGGWISFLDADPALLERNFRINVTALFHLCRATIPDMTAAGRGVILVTGNTSAHRGKAHTPIFAPTKAAQRILCQSLARDFGPKGVHVAYITVDALIDTPATRPRLAPGKPDDFFAGPAAIAEEMFHVAHQDRSAWSFDVELRPFGEVW